ncbi:hypothetical protein J4466_05960 [Candidatus Pacearchaeota archaeon]|nr:hypothetical protein [uncultured archaeon]AQS29338.1 hypothetical protein [uncultured archaeon]MBS3092933.1 hypothetical protein [Candidatus Pacearchaeota archaeon]
MGRTRIASADLSELRKRISECKENKRKVESYLFDLKDKWIFKEISSSEYENALNEKRDGRTLEEWVEFYDDYISKCEIQINKNQSIIDKSKNIFLLVLIPIIIIALLVSLYFIKPATIIGLVINENQKILTQELNINTNNSAYYNWQPTAYGELTSVDISGTFEKTSKDGYVKIYLKDIIIFDSSQEIKKGTITGSAIKKTETENPNFLEKLFSLFSFKARITGKASENSQPAQESSSNQQENPSQDQGQKESQDSTSSSEENKQENPNKDEAAPQKETSPSQEEPSSSETANENTNEAGNNTETQPSEKESSQDQTVNESEHNEQEQNAQNSESNNETAGNVNKDKTGEKTDGQQNSENQLIEFLNACQETCDLSKLNLIEDSYNLRIEISNANLNLKKIKYSILPLEKPEKQAEENKAEENAAEINETIKEEINETKIENITQNITSKPTLIKDIPNIEIQKNTFAIIKVNNYFSNADQYYVLQAENLSTTTYDHIIRINPDANFTGTRTIKLIVKNLKGEQTESNYFNLTISENVLAPVFIKDIQDIAINKNSFSQLTLTEYFSNADQYFMLQTEDITTSLIENNIIKLTPRGNFTGIRKSSIIAFNEFGGVESNEFTINVLDITQEIPEEENITKEFNFTELGINISTLQYKAVINKPVKWIKVINAEKAEDIQNLTIELPKKAENISIKTGEEIQQALAEIGKYNNIIEDASQTGSILGITGNVALDISNSGGIITKLWRWLKSLTRSGITGNVIQESEIKSDISELPDKKEINLGSIAEKTNESDIAVEYYTQGPVAEEENISNGKRIFISSADEENYTDILAFSEVPEKFKKGQESQIKIYWREKNSYVNFTAYDADNNGMLDYVAWIVPHLSNQTFDIIIITKAEHLDENKIFISDIYEQVKELDGNWSEEIPDSHYVRVTFERNLTKDNDITLYPRIVSGNPRISVYEFNKLDLIAEFSSLNSDQYNKIFLTNLISESQDVFDLKIVGGSIEIDHIIDPTWQENVANGTNPVYNGTLAETKLQRVANSTMAAGDVAKITAKDNVPFWVPGNTTALDTYVFVNFTIVSSGYTAINVSVWSNISSTTSTSVKIALWNFSAGASGNWTSVTTGGSTANTLLSYKFTYFSDFVSSNQVRVMAYESSGATRQLMIDYIGINVSVDTQQPVVAFTYPANSSNYSSNSIGVNYTVSDDGTLSRCAWTNNTGVTNKTITCNTNISGETWLQGINNITIYANDSVANSNSSTITFFVDSVNPSINITAPLNASNLSTSTVEVNYTVSDLNLQACKWTNSSGRFNTTIACGANISFSWFEGWNNITIYANDSFNFVNSTTVSFFVDSQIPYFTHEIPNQESTNGSGFNYDVNATDDGIGLQAYKVNDSTFTVNSSGWITNASALDVSLYYINISINDSLGNQNSTVFYVNTTAPSNTPPQIVQVFNSSFIQSGITLNDGPSDTNITINFTAYDAEGASNLNSSSAMINITRGGEPVRANSSCAQINAAGNQANYTCQVTLYWFDSDGPWNITASIKDNLQEFAQNSTTTLVINTLTGFVVSSSLSFSSINPGSVNNTPTGNLRLNNTGNQMIVTGSISVNATSLRGEQDITKYFYSGNFSISNNTAAGKPECDILTSSGGGTAINLSEISGNSFVPVNGTYVNATLTRGNFTVNNGETGQEDLYICLRIAGSELSSQAYSTSSLGSWTIKIALAVFTLGSGARNVKTKTLPKKKKKLKEDRLSKTLLLTADELKEKYSLNNAETLRFIIKQLGEKYKVGDDEIKEILGLTTKENIPVTIFSKELGGLEALCKYMKENLGMSYHEIAEKLKRNDRTVWTAYKKSLEKQKTPMEIRETEILLPIKIFKKEHTILEAVIVYLKEVKRLNYREIGELLGRDQRNVYTIYSRAVRKLKRILSS